MAAIGSASASAGSGTCHATSISQAPQDRSPALADDMPPAGNSPVRAAMNTKTSDVSSGGSDTHTADTARIAARVTAPPLPPITPSTIPLPVATTRATSARMAVLSAAGASTRATGRL